MPGDEDVEDLINCMKNALDKSDTCTFARFILLYKVGIIPLFLQYL